jgi:hypothetical protein
MKNEDEMMIVGCEMMTNETMELTLIPLSILKKKAPSIMDLASGGLESIMATMDGNKQYKTKMYIPVATWDKMKLSIRCHVTVVLSNE